MAFFPLVTGAVFTLEAWDLVDGVRCDQLELLADIQAELSIVDEVAETVSLLGPLLVLLLEDERVGVA